MLVHANILNSEIEPFIAVKRNNFEGIGEANQVLVVKMKLGFGLTFNSCFSQIFNQPRWCRGLTSRSLWGAWKRKQKHMRLQPKKSDKLKLKKWVTT